MKASFAGGERFCHE